MLRLGMCSNNLNCLQNKTSRLYHIRRTFDAYKSVHSVVESPSGICFFFCTFATRVFFFFDFLQDCCFSLIYSSLC